MSCYVMLCYVIYVGDSLSVCLSSPLSFTHSYDMISCCDITSVILSFNLMPSSMTPFFPYPDSPTLPTLPCLPFIPSPSSLAQAAVPKYLKLEMLPASSSSIPPNSSGAVTQEIRVVNSQQGEKNIMLKLKIGYFQGGVQVCYTTIY